jgi:hypothetical protein
VARGRGGDDFDVMAFPVHRPANWLAAWCAGDGLEIGGGEGEVRVSGDGEAHGHGGPARVGGSLRPSVPRSRRKIGSDHRPWSSTAGPAADR